MKWNVFSLEAVKEALKPKFVLEKVRYGRKAPQPYIDTDAFSSPYCLGSRKRKSQYSGNRIRTDVESGVKL